MNKMICSTLLTMVCCQITFSQIDTIKYGLKGKIIRALEKSPTSSSTVYAGLKGNNLGTGFMYKSSDAGHTWHVLNNGQPIDPYVSDIQAVAETRLQNKTLYAGTWKNGLFKSENGGESWEKDTTFPSSDVRSIRTGIQNPNLIYAATSNFGVVRSNDGGNTWHRNSPQQIDTTFQFAWSIETDPNNDGVIYALTFSGGVWKSNDQGEHWDKSLDTEGKVAWDMKISDGSDELWVATSMRGDSLSAVYHSADAGTTWKEIADVPQIGVSEINVYEHNEQRVLFVGSWRDGVYQFKNDEWEKVENVDFSSIAHIIVQDNKVLIGSWGNGMYTIEPSQ